MSFLKRMPTGTVAVVFTLVVVGALVALSGGAMFNPGALNADSRPGVTRGGVASHADLKNNCSACHGSPLSGKSMADRCLDCHTEVREQLNAKGPLHGNLTNAMNCRECHTEHKGAHADITDMTKFDHDFTAFKLTGAHVMADCKRCHINNTFKGTSQTCVSCHAEPKSHHGKFGTNCVSCHNTATWHGAFAGKLPSNFNHDLTGFKLTGKHTAVACASCHVNNVFKGTSSSCVSCHAEPKSHFGKFGTNCTSCHSTSTWRGATLTSSSFKHTFPINHGNSKLGNACTVCHKVEADYHIYTCYGCHAHDPAKMARKHSKLTAVQLKAAPSATPGGRGHGERAGRGLEDLMKPKGKDKPKKPDE